MPSIKVTITVRNAAEAWSALTGIPLGLRTRARLLDLIAEEAGEQYVERIIRDNYCEGLPAQHERFEEILSSSRSPSILAFAMGRRPAGERRERTLNTIAQLRDVAFEIVRDKQIELSPEEFDRLLRAAARVNPKQGGNRAYKLLHALCYRFTPEQRELIINMLSASTDITDVALILERPRDYFPDAAPMTAEERAKLFSVFRNSRDSSTSRHWARGLIDRSRDGFLPEELALLEDIAGRATA